MTRTEVDKFRNVLEMNVIELEFATRRRDAIAVQESADELDRLLMAKDRDFAVKHLEAASTRLRETRAALRRIHQGTYGTCLECDEPISTSRLKALPWAPLCIHCQEKCDHRCAARQSRPRLAMAA